MEAGDGALTPDRRPAPSRDANRSPAVPPRWSQRIVMFQTGVSRISMPSDEYEAGSHARPDLWHQAATRRTSRYRPPSGWISRCTRDRCPNGGRLPGRLQSDDQSPAPALPGCAIVFPSAFNFQREFKDPRSNAHPLPRTDTTILQWFSLGTQAL